MTEQLQPSTTSPNNNTTSQQQSTGIHAQDIFIFYAREGILPELKVLLDQGVDVNGEDRFNHTTALIEASKHSHSKIVKFLCKSAAPKSQNASSAASSTHATALNLNHETPNHEIALIEATKNNSLNIVQTLLKYGANPNIQDSLTKTTALHEAVKISSLPLVKLLRENGAVGSLRDNLNKVPLDHATTNRIRKQLEGSQDETLQEVVTAAAANSPTAAASGKKQGRKKKQKKNASSAKSNASNTGKRRIYRRKAKNPAPNDEYTEDMQDDEDLMIDEEFTEAAPEDEDVMMDEATTAYVPPDQKTPLKGSSRRNSSTVNNFNSTTRTTKQKRKNNKTATTSSGNTKPATRPPHVHQTPKAYERIASRTLSVEAKNYYSKLTDAFMAFSQTEDEEMREELANMLYSEGYFDVYDSILNSTAAIVKS